MALGLSVPAYVGADLDKSINHTFGTRQGPFELVLIRLELFDHS